MGESTEQQTQTAASTGVLGTIVLSRTTISGSFRIVYPFLPVISRGLGVPLKAVSFLLTLRALVGLSSPLFGPLSDRHGRRSLMLVGLGMLAMGAALLRGAEKAGRADQGDPRHCHLAGSAADRHKRGTGLGAGAN
jgi:predicted MFS family arabinose efflux permease